MLLSEALGPGGWREHVGLVVSGGLSALVVLRVLAVAHFDLVTAAAILQRGGTSAVLVGSVVATVPLLLAAVYPVLVAMVATRRSPS